MLSRLDSGQQEGVQPGRLEESFGVGLIEGLEVDHHGIPGLDWPATSARTVPLWVVNSLTLPESAYSLPRASLAVSPYPAISTENRMPPQHRYGSTMPA